MLCLAHQPSPKLELTVRFILWDGTGRAEPQWVIPQEGCQPELAGALHGALLFQRPPTDRLF